MTGLRSWLQEHEWVQTVLVVLLNLAFWILLVYLLDPGFHRPCGADGCWGPD